MDALPAGTYYFDCQAHTGMGGTFIVEYNYWHRGAVVIHAGSVQA